ncbi:MAG: helix-turn-helix transcriptional regulator [Lachnospiraceae bacterium]|nr:helix-turn-helix transcriptional regulator [Lachnospiraceae bacterium]
MKKRVVIVEKKDLIYKNLVYARWQRGWTQAFVSRQTGISIRTLSRAENGKGLSRDTLFRLAEFYGFPLEAFYTEWNHTPYKIKLPQIPLSSIANLLYQSNFIQTLQAETCLQFNNLLQQEAMFYIEDIDLILKESCGRKDTYSRKELIKCCMSVNRSTLQRIGKLILA